MPEFPDTVIIQSDYFNALYEDGSLVEQGKPDYLDVETLARLKPYASIYFIPDDVYDKALNGRGFPARLVNFPLDKCEKVR